MNGMMKIVSSGESTEDGITKTRGTKILGPDGVPIKGVRKIILVADVDDVWRATIECTVTPPPEVTADCVIESAFAAALGAPFGGLPPIHTTTEAAVINFARALYEKLGKAEAKYGYTNDWNTKGITRLLQMDLIAHLDKGDPVDVGAYAMFLHARGEPTIAARELRLAKAADQIDADNWRRLVKMVGEGVVRTRLPFDIGGGITDSYLPSVTEFEVIVQCYDEKRGIRAAIETARERAKSAREGVK